MAFQPYKNAVSFFTNRLCIGVALSKIKIIQIQGILFEKGRIYFIKIQISNHAFGVSAPRVSDKHSAGKFFIEIHFGTVQLENVEVRDKSVKVAISYETGSHQIKEYYFVEEYL